MPGDADLAFTPAYELARLVAARSVSPVELTELTLRRVEQFNDTLHAYLLVMADEALAAAAEAERAVMRGDELGPLHGVPVPIKDLVPVRGVRTTLGSLAFADWAPDEDDLVVRRIRNAGAVIVGKTNTPEFGHLAVTRNLLGEDCRNPWDPERESGGSSGGAAASVASGITAIAQGGDGGGSIRIPCSLCGLYGIKGTEGRVPRSDSGALAAWHPYNLAQTGPLSRTVRDSALLLQVLAGPGEGAQPGTIQAPPPDFPGALDGGVQGLRIGWTPDLAGAVVDPEVADTTERAAHAFEDLGATVEPFTFEVDRAELELTFRNYFNLLTYERWGHILRDDPDMLTDYVREGMEYAAALTAVDHQHAVAWIARYRAYMRGVFERYDLLMSPTLATTAFRCADGPPEKIAGVPVADPDWAWTPFTYAVNMAGNPAASIPCGFDSNGLPIGLHVIGRIEDEATVLRASAAYERAHPWADRRPPVS